MTFFESIAVILTVAAIAGYINERIIKWPPTIGLLAISLSGSVLLVIFGGVGLVDLDNARLTIEAINFEEVVLNGMLAFLLFAGALHVDIARLKDQLQPIIALATVGVVLSTFITGTLFWLAANWLGFDIPLIWALVFGAIISPTDPIAALSVLKVVRAPKILEIKIAGESLFNDGMAVVTFVTLLVIATGEEDLSFVSVSIDLVQELLGGCLLGFVLGWLTWKLMKSIDNYSVELMLTLALVTGGYALALMLHVSGPIVVVVAGIFIGNQGARVRMSELTRDHLSVFWDLIDSVLNAALFILIGLEVIVISVTSSIVKVGLLTIPIVLAARFISVSLPISLMRLNSYRVFSDGVIRVLTWGGLRGGVSVALALSIPASEYRDLIITVTYMVVIFSIIVQGLTFSWVVNKIHPSDLELEVEAGV